MSALLESVALNSLAALALALLILVAGRVWHRPELLHVLWLVVLVKLVTPGVIRLHALPDVLGPTPALLPMPTAGALPLADLSAAIPVVLRAADPARWPAWSSAVWIAGSVLFLAFVSFQCLRFARAMRAASPAGRVLEERVAHLAQRIQVAPPRTWVLDATVPPMVWGTLRQSTLVLPSQLLNRLTANETDTLLTHELAHLKRRDPWIRWVELGVTAALWWNPLVWWVRRRLRHAEEQACDRRVLELFPRAQRAYADAIVKTVEFLAGHGRAPQFATGAAGTRHIKERLTMILNHASKRRLRHPLVPAILLALLALPIVPGFAERNDREDEQARAELLELQREALELEQRLHRIQIEQEEIRIRLGETRVRAEAVETHRMAERLARQGRHEEAAELETRLERMERQKARQMAQQAEMLDRERQTRDSEFEMQEARIAYERARDENDLSAVEDYERALADSKSSHAERSAAYEEAQQMYKRALMAQQQEVIAGKLEEMISEYERLRRANRDAEADRLAVMIEKLHIESDYQRQKEGARQALAGHKVRAQLAELEMAFENTEDDAERKELQRTIEVLTRKLRALEYEERQGGVR